MDEHDEPSTPLVSWSELPWELLGTIHQRLPLVDRLRFPAVCWSWQSAAAGATTTTTTICVQTASSPWLMLPSNQTISEKKPVAAAAARFFSLSEHRTYSIPQPGPSASDRLCIGSSDGWLITADAASELHLLNPVAGVQIDLPSVTTLPFVHAARDVRGRVISYSLCCAFTGDDDEEIMMPPESFAPDHLRYVHYEKAILLSKPRMMPSSTSSPKSSQSWGGYAVLLIHQPLFRLSIATAGNDKWTLLDTPAHYWVDAICASPSSGVDMRPVMYTLDSEGCVEAWDVDVGVDGIGGSPVPLLSRAVTSTCPCSGCPCSAGRECTRYLVELSPGHLVQVHRWREATHTRYNWEPRPDHVEYTTVRVELFECKVGTGSGPWMPVVAKDGQGPLHGRALFLGKNASFCVSVCNCPELRGNCIYFTDDGPWSFDKCHEVTPDVGVFNLSDGRYKPCCASHELLWKWPPPIWVMPMLP